MATCPSCGKTTTSLGMIQVDDDVREGQLREIFRCLGDCTQKVPYPGEADGSDSDWPVEFYLDEEGRVQYVRPPASEFA